MNNKLSHILYLLHCENKREREEKHYIGCLKIVKDAHAIL
jgi:hypothetical protein